MSENVGIVIVSHSADVARGTALMVEQMVGREVPLGWCGGDPDGGLGTNVEAIMAAALLRPKTGLQPTTVFFAREKKRIRIYAHTRTHIG